MALPSPSPSTSRATPEPLSEKFRPQLLSLCATVSPSVVALLSYFAGYPDREIPHSARRGTGVFVEPRLIVTSARVVGRVSGERGGASIRNCYLARTIALTPGEKVLRATPVAVDFSHDVAVLRVAIPRNERKSLPPPLPVAKIPANDNRPLLGIARHENCSVLTATLPGIRRSRGEKPARPAAPWPMDDELEWIDYGAGENQDHVIASIADFSGSPWFNFRKEVVGIASWAAEEADGRINSYSIPPSGIRSVVHYAKTKGPNDPIVMDRWIDSVHNATDQNWNIVEECVPRWTRNVVFQMYV